MAFLAALQFLTIAPPLLRRAFTTAEMGRAVAYFPLIGLLIGGLLLGADELFQEIWSSGIRAALLLALWVLATGALHLDGFLDSCDGLFGGRTPEKRLEIMRDEHVGAFAVVGGILLLLVKYAALASVQDRLGAYLVAPVLGRFGMALAIVTFPYARAEGLGRAMKDHAGWRELLLATLTAGAVSWMAGRERGLVALALAGALTWLTARLVLFRLPGLTGDVYGAICEVVEVTVLLFFAARIPL